MQRFFLSKSSFVENKFILTGDDAFHISRSLRMRSGDHISVSISDGRVFDCVLTAFTSDSVTAEVVSVSECNTESPCKVCIYQALPKSDKLDTIIQKSVETGAHVIVPFESERCVVKVDADARREEKKLLLAFESMEELRTAELARIREVQGISETDAKAVYDYFHGGKEE